MEQEIRKTMGQTMSLFKDEQISLFLKVAYSQGFLEHLSVHMHRVYDKKNAIPDIRVIESLLSVALYHCDNSYCYIVHSSILLRNGFKITDVQRLLDLLELPEDIPDRHKWASIVRLTYFSFKDRLLMPENFRKIKLLLSEQEHKDFIAIIAFANFLQFLLYAFYDEIQISKETLFHDSNTGEFQKEIQNLVDYYESSIATRRRDENIDSVPVFTICSYSFRKNNSKTFSWMSYNHL